MLSIFSCTSWASVCLLWSNVYLGLLPSFFIGLLVFLLLGYMSHMYILEVKPLSVASFASIFCLSVVCLFLLFMVPFAVQKHISLIRSHLYLLLLLLPWETGLRIHWYNLLMALLFKSNLFLIFFL